MGLIFGLLVGFLVADVWADHERAATAVSHEASALRDVDLLARMFPAGPAATAASAAAGRTAMALALTLLVAQAAPFAGYYAVGPDPLLQVRPGP
jgi:hypothetical protein